MRKFNFCLTDRYLLKRILELISEKQLFHFSYMPFLPIIGLNESFAIYFAATISPLKFVFKFALAKIACSNSTLFEI